VKRKAHTTEYERFDSTMQRLIRVSHAEIKAKLDAEKRQKAQKQKAKKNDTEKRNRH